MLGDIGELLNENRFLKAAQKSLDKILENMDKKGFIPGRFDSDFNSTVKWACLTGIAQIGVTSMKAYQKFGEQKYFKFAFKIKEFLKSCQNNVYEEYGGKGAMWGSWPISGGYGRYEVLNWAVKYFVDLLLYQNYAE